MHFDGAGIEASDAARHDGDRRPGWPRRRHLRRGTRIRFFAQTSPTSIRAILSRWRVRASVNLTITAVGASSLDAAAALEDEARR
jgi:hypothetical protein